MDTRIDFDGVPTADDSQQLNELTEALRRSDFVVRSLTAPKGPGVKSAGLTLGLSIASLAISAVGTLISVISVWGSKRNYTLTFKSGDTTISANSLNPKEAIAIASALRDKIAAAHIRILVSRK